VLREPVTAGAGPAFRLHGTPRARPRRHAFRRLLAERRKQFRRWREAQRELGTRSTFSFIASAR
jgi:hypothetical protein